MNWRWLMLCLLLLGAAWADEDPYLWLQEVDGERALEWVHQQNAATAERLRAFADFDSLQRQALEILNSESRLPEVRQEAGWLYNFWRDAEHPRGIYRRTTVAEFAQDAPAWETVLDIDALAAAENEKWVFKGMRCLPKEYVKCLVFLSPGGGDAVVMREFDAVAKSFLDDGFSLPESKMRVAWRDRDSLFVGTDFGPGSMTDSGYPRIVKLWRRGTPLSEAATIYEGGVDSVSVFAYRLRGDGGHVDLVFEATDFWNARVLHLTAAGLKELRLPSSARIEDLYEGRLLVSLKAPWTRVGRSYGEGSVLIAEPAALWRDDGPVELLLAPTETMVIEGVGATPQGVLVAVLDNVRGRLLRLEPTADGGWTRRELAFPDNGSLSVTSIDDESGELFVTFESFTTPASLYYVAGPQWAPRLIKAQSPTFDGTRFEVDQWFATSADGTRVPYFVVRSRNLVADGSHPTHIFSYGGFRNALTPSYSGSYEPLSGAYGKLWLERGGVFVLANIRGGGEYGPRWHAAALKQNRHKAFEDFEAVAADLIARGITSPEHLGIEGRSNGGLLVSAAFTRRPELYGAVVCGVPLADMRRYHELLAGASWMAEYGDPDDPEMWAYIKTYSPYHNLKPGQDYPAVLFYTSTRDDRVHPAHARKMAAKMIDLGYEVWYYENTEGGHGGSSTNEQLAYRLALSYSHLWSQLR